MSEQLGVLFLVLFMVAVAACIYLSMTMSRRVQAGITRWRNEEKQALETELKQLADTDTRLQFERWKQDHEQQIRVDAIQRWSRLAGQNGGLAKVDSVFDYAANFSSFAWVA